MRRFSTSGARLARRRPLQQANARPLEMRPPIEPRVRDVQTPEDHPLWQFFSERRFLRPAAEFDNDAAAWSVAQLRRKSFEDLHTLWYVSLRELNRLDRERRLMLLYENGPGDELEGSRDDSSVLGETAKAVRTTMWRVRHVLAERYHAYRALQVTRGSEDPIAEIVGSGEAGDASEAAAEFSTAPGAAATTATTTEGALSTFREQFLTADANADSQVNAALERFQYAFYGINPLLEGNFPEPTLARGLRVVAQLKLERYASEQKEVENVADIREAFTLFGVDASPEGVADAIETIKAVRADSSPVPRARDVEVLAELMHASN